MNKNQKLPLNEQARNNRVAELLSNKQKQGKILTSQQSNTNPQPEKNKVSNRNDDKDALAQYAENLREQRKQHWQQLSQRFI